MECVSELREDIQLSYHSVSAKQGHFGTCTKYIAAEHRVVFQKWGAMRRLFGLLPPKQIPQTVESLDIPVEVTGEDDIREYVQKHKPGWLRSRDCKRRPL